MTVFLETKLVKKKKLLLFCIIYKPEFRCKQGFTPKKVRSINLAIVA